MIPDFICNLCYKGNNGRNNCGTNIFYDNSLYCKECIIGGVPLEIDTKEGTLMLFYSGEKLELSKIEQNLETLLERIKNEVKKRRIIF